MVHIEKYFLDVQNSQGVSLGKTSSTTDVGTKTIGLTDLSLGTEYANCKVVAYDANDGTTVLKESKTFTFTTLKKLPLNLTNPTVENIMKTSVTVKTTVSETTMDNGDYKDYILDVVDSDGVSIGKSGTINTDGEQTIDLNGLSPGTEYKDYKVIACDSEDPSTIYATSSNFTFTTLLKTINKLTLPTVDEITKTSARVTTTAIDDGTNSEDVFEEYILDVQDCDGVSLGKSTKLSSDGEQIININELIPGKTYKDSKIVAYSSTDEQKIFATSPNFTFTTLKKTADTLSLPIASDIEKTSATIKTTVSSDPLLNGNLKNYVLDVQDSNGLSLGKSGILSEEGPQIINLTGLTFGTTYDDSKVVAYDAEDEEKIFATSPNFTFTTLKKTADTLTLPVVSDIEKTSATIKTTVSSDPLLNGDLKNYVLDVQDSNGASLGKSGTLSEEGPQTIYLTDLTIGKEYNDSKVVAYDATDEEKIFATSPNFSFTTLKETTSTLSLPVASDIMKTSATIKTTVSSDPSLNGQFKDYILDVQDSNGVSLGKSGILSEGGPQVINLTDLTLGTTYANSKVVAYDATDEVTIFAISPDFSFETPYSIVNSLTDVSSLDSETTSATIQANVVSDAIESNSNVEEYSLEVIDSSGSTVGTSDAINLKTDGVKTFNLTGLKAGTTYEGLRVRVVDTNIKSTEDFKIQTKARIASVLSNAKIKEGTVTYDSAIISVDVSAKDEANSETLQDYSLIVSGYGSEIWESDSFDSDGNKEIKINNLLSGHTYDYLMVSIKGTPIKISVPSFTTLESPIKPNAESFKVDKNSLNNHSFIFSIDIDFGEGYDSKDFDPNTLVLTSNGKDLKTSYLESTELNGKISYTYKVSGLKTHKKYKDLQIGFNNSDKKTPINVVVTTKRNFAVTVTLEVLILIVLILLIIVSVMAIMTKDKTEQNYYVRPPFK